MKIAIKREQSQASLSYAERAQFGAKLNTTKLFFMAALALIFAACSNDDDELTQQPVEQSTTNMIHITAKLAPKSNDAQTRAVDDKGDGKITVDWALNEKLKIIGEGGEEATANIDAVDASGVATISFDIANTAKDKDCTIIYPYDAAVTKTAGVYTANPILSQDGTLNASLDVRIGEGFITLGDPPTLEVTTQPAAQFAIFKFTLSGPSIDATHPLVIKDNASNKTITTVTPASTATSVFVAMPAAASTTYKFVVITADNKYIKSGTATIEAGKYYQTPLTMEPRYPLDLRSATADDLGAVVNSDGQMSVEKAAASGTALGIVGKVTETGHGLILALQDAPPQTWDIINKWESVTTYAGTTLKQLPAGALGSLTSYFWLTRSLSDLIPVSNWCVAQKSDYEAIFQNLGSTTVSYGYTYDDNVNAYITTGVGGAAMDDSYWSATEYEYDNLCAWFFCRGYWIGRTSGVKSNRCSVRPVLGF